MNWDAVGAIAETLGAVGVIATLLYLTTQIRHNTKALRVSAFHASTQSLVGENDLLAANGELADIVQRALAGESLSPTEQLRFDFALTSNFRSLEEGFYLRDEELLDPRLWRRIDVSLNRLVRLKAVQDYWSREDFGYDEGFKAYVDAKIAELSE